jgi:hypothetical protein
VLHATTMADAAVPESGMTGRLCDAVADAGSDARP